MWKNYFKIAVKNLLKRKLYAGINVFGLATAIACFVLLALYLENEWTYDRWYKNASELYRLRMDYGENGEKPVQTALTPNLLAPTIKDLPEVNKVTRVYYSEGSIQYEDKNWSENRLLYVDAPFFEMFSFPLIAGNAATVLNGPNMVVISASMAKKYFGDADPIGKTLKVNGSRTLQITGVAVDAPANTHLKFNFVASYSTLKLENKWFSANYYTYVQLKNPAQLPSLKKSLTAIAHQSLSEGDVRNGETLDFVPEPVVDIHLHSISANTVEEKGDVRYNYIFAAIGLMLLIIACINFMNLATARSTERSREVGVRKALGAQRGQLFWQFMVESAVLTGIAMVIGLVLAKLLLPAFNQLASVRLQMSGAGGYRIYLMLAGVFFLVSFVTGIYPALFLSGFRPVQVLKGTQTATPKGRGIRQSLVVFQFAASIFFIICTLVVQQQMQYIQHKKIGLDRSDIMMLYGFSANEQELESFKARLLQLPGVTNVTASAESPVRVQGGYSIDNIEGKVPKFSLNINALPIEKDFLKTMDISLVSGEDLTRADIADILKPSEERAYHFFLNETAVKKLGWTPEEAVGKRMMLNGRHGTIKGVIKDFHFTSMKSKIEPLMLFPEYEWFGAIYVKNSSHDKQRVIASVGALWKEVQPDVPFNYDFLDDDFSRMYRSEYRVGTVLGIFATVVMVVSCLGLLGLAALTTQQRTREIGIRKVLGASVTNVVAMLSKDFIRLVLIALLAAIPAAWYIGHHWLEAFAYHASLSIWLFLIAGALAILVALLTVGLQSVRAATMDPVRSLKSE